jgi:regulator of sirC expression with transglutaminase-like and TPR domain
MTTPSRERLLRHVRQADADPVEAALLCAVEADPDLDVDAALLRVDALADTVRTRALSGAAGERRGDPRTDPRVAADVLAAELGGRQGFTGDTVAYHDPANALLHRVLQRKRGLPIALAIVYVGIARRLGVPAYAIALPGHVVAAVADGANPIVLDPFHGGIRLDEPSLVARVAAATGGQVAYHRAMLRPAPTVALVRRLLNNLTRDLAAAEQPLAALRTVELKLLLPNREPTDHRVLGELSLRAGRFDRAAAAFETYLAQLDADAPDREPVRRAAIGARARLN